MAASASEMVPAPPPHFHHAIWSSHSFFCNHPEASHKSPHCKHWIWIHCECKTALCAKCFFDKLKESPSFFTSNRCVNCRKEYQPSFCVTKLCKNSHIKSQAKAADVHDVESYYSDIESLFKDLPYYIGK